MAKNLLEGTPPHDLDAEKALIGAMLLSSSVIDETSVIVEATDFYREAHKTCYEAILDMQGEGKSVDVISLASYLDGFGLLEKVGGKGYLLEIVGTCVLTSNAKDYAEIVRERSKSRKMIEIGRTVMIAGYDQPEEVEAVVADAMSGLMGIAVNANDDSKPASVINKEFMEELRGPVPYYITPPWIPFVKARKGDLVVVAAGPSVGKTAIALNWADEWSKTHKVTYFEYEMTEADLMARLICKHAGVTWEQILERQLTAEEMERIEAASKDLSSRHLRIKEVWCNVGKLVAQIRQEAKRGCEIVMIDHLGLIPFDMPSGASWAKAIGVAITGRLKRLASELGIIIVILSQLNREGQGEGFPKLRHLRDSGEIEQDAAIVLMLWSERSVQDDPAKKLSIRESSEILSREELFRDFELIRIGVEKNRNGRLGHKYVLFHGEHFQYEERSPITHAWQNEEVKLFTDEEVLGERGSNSRGTASGDSQIGVQDSIPGGSELGAG